MGNQFALAILAASAIAGCYASSSLEGDTLQDSRQDISNDNPLDVTPDENGEITGDTDVDSSIDFSPDFPVDILPNPDGSTDGWWDQWVDADPSLPPPSDVEVAFIIDGIVEPPAPVTIVARCTVTDVQLPLPTIIMITLECDEGGATTTHVIEVQTFPPLRIELPAGTEVTFTYVTSESFEMPSWVNRWFTLTLADDMLFMAGTDADNIAPHEIDRFVWYSPLKLYPSDEGYHWAALDCYDYERLMIAFNFDGPPFARVDIWDHGEGWIGLGTSFHIRVGEASRRRNIHCEGISEFWYSMLIVLDAYE